jgi:hypothetical protein
MSAKAGLLMNDKKEKREMELKIVVKKEDALRRTFKGSIWILLLWARRAW